MLGIGSGPWLAMLVAAITIPVLIGLARAGRGVGSDFAIRYRPGRGTTVRGRVPAGKVGAIAEFFARDLRPGRPVTVHGTWGPGRSLRLQFSGALSPFQRQQARNFLTNHLR